LLAALIGLIVVRFTGIYFLLLTFAFGELLYSVVWKFRWFQTPGIEAIIDLPHPDLGIPHFKWTPLNFYFLVLIVFLVCYFLLLRMTKARFGQILIGIRENEPRMRALGYNTWLYKYLSFVIAGLFAGIGGVFFVYEMRFSMPDLLGLNYSYLGQVMVILGGGGNNFWGGDRSFSDFVSGADHESICSYALALDYGNYPRGHHYVFPRRFGPPSGEILERNIDPRWKP
jgi:branched-chain amino acid transport system permease protein